MSQLPVYQHPYPAVDGSQAGVGYPPPQQPSYFPGTTFPQYTQYVPTVQPQLQPHLPQQPQPLSHPQTQGQQLQQFIWATVQPLAKGLATANENIQQLKESRENTEKKLKEKEEEVASLQEDIEDLEKLLQTQEKQHAKDIRVLEEELHDLQSLVGQVPNVRGQGGGGQQEQPPQLTPLVEHINHLWAAVQGLQYRPDPGVQQGLEIIRQQDEMIQRQKEEIERLRNVGNVSGGLTPTWNGPLVQ